MTANSDVMGAFREAFRLDDLTIQVENGWTVSVRPGQITLGSMVVSSTLGRLDFQDIEAEEAAGLSAAFAGAERVAKNGLGAVRINLVCLMMKDPIVHFHVLPRYDQPVERYGVTWEDTDWPGPPSFVKTTTPDEVLHSILADLRTSMLVDPR